jgi:hypothetical protein
MKQYILIVITLLSLGALWVETTRQEKEISELKVRLDEQELLNKIGKELITSRLNIR